jgi:hypothetical protein
LQARRRPGLRRSFNNLTLPPAFLVGGVLIGSHPRANGTNPLRRTHSVNVGFTKSLTAVDQADKLQAPSF